MTWDRSRRWKLEHWHIHRARVRIRFAADRPTIAEIAAVRKAFPRFADVAPADLRARLDAAGELDLGIVGLLEARWLARDAAEVGLAAIVEQQGSATRSSTSPTRLPSRTSSTTRPSTNGRFRR